MAEKVSEVQCGTFGDSKANTTKFVCSGKLTGEKINWLQAGTFCWIVIIESWPF